MLIISQEAPGGTSLGVLSTRGHSLIGRNSDCCSATLNLTFSISLFAVNLAGKPVRVCLNLCAFRRRMTVARVSQRMIQMMGKYAPMMTEISCTYRWLDVPAERNLDRLEGQS